ncbi:hypothetical protein ACFV9E_42170 [Streptomyces sp. NPDC059835]|uniref:hypothetical protein n=1 Tax=Streptomyces sp. NPDC059835 TaxID=3346967 RepID=UPI00365FD8B4
MITNPPSLTARLHRLPMPGYRGPLLLAVLLAVIAAPDSPVRERVVFGTVLTGLFAAVPLMAMLAWGLVRLAVSPAARSRVRRLRRPGNSVLLGCLLASGAVALGYSVPGEDLGMLAMGLVVLGLLPFAWFAWQMASTAEPTEGAGAGRLRGLWRWAAAPLLVGTTVLLIHHGLPLQARFAIARPALTSYAEQALATGSVDPHQTWIGGYPVRDAELADGGLKFAIGGSGLFARHGYAYLPPNGPTPHSDEYVHVSGPWYSWSGPDHF